QQFGREFERRNEYASTAPNGRTRGVLLEMFGTVEERRTAEGPRPARAEPAVKESATADHEGEERLGVGAARDEQPELLLADVATESIEQNLLLVDLRRELELLSATGEVGDDARSRPERERDARRCGDRNERLRQEAPPPRASPRHLELRPRHDPAPQGFQIHTLHRLRPKVGKRRGKKRVGDPLLLASVSTHAFLLANGSSASRSTRRA